MKALETDILAESGEIVGHRFATRLVFESILRLLLLHHTAVSWVGRRSGRRRWTPSVIHHRVILHAQCVHPAVFQLYSDRFTLGGIVALNQGDMDTGYTVVVTLS